MAEYKLRPKALKDIEGIWSYSYKTWGVQQARNYLENIHDICKELTANPKLGKSRDDLHPGLLVYPSGKHLIFYLLIDKELDKGIDIVRILHERMDSYRHFL